MDISIVIVSYNVKEKLKNNLLSIFNSQAGFSYEIFVVDNNSSDDSATMVRENFPSVNLIVNQTNLGFAQACNKAIKQSTGDFVLLLNPDMKVFPDTLLKILLWAKANNQASIIGCRLIDEAGNLIKHVRRFPQLWDQLAIIFKIPHFFKPKFVANYLCDNFDYQKSAPVDSIRGSFFLIRRSAIEKIGLLDENFFIWFEEVDYCQRAIKVGLEVWYTPAATCIDYVGQSFKTLPLGEKQQLFKESQLKYFSKWRPLREKIILEIAWLIVDLILFFYPKKSD